MLPEGRMMGEIMSKISDEMVELPKDRKGQTLHIGDEVLVYSYNREPIGQGEVVSMTLVLLEPTAWYVDLHMGVIGDKRYRTSCGGFDPHELERIEVADDGTD